MQKVGDRLSKYNIVNEVFDAIGEIAKKSDFISAGLKDQDVYALCRQGYLERVKKGVLQAGRRRRAQRGAYPFETDDVRGHLC